MTANVVARVLGAAFLLAGIAGFIPIITAHAPPDAQVITLDAGYGMLFALFPVNAAHNALHVFFGLWGLVAGRSFSSGVGYCRAVAVVYAILVVRGAIPITNTLFGAAPIYGHDVWLHALIALVAAYGGYGAASRERQSPIDSQA